jgi:uncharacterized protein DUF4124
LALLGGLVQSKFTRMMVGSGLLVCLAWAAPAIAGVNKCVDAQGNIVFTDRPCGKDEKKQEMKTQAPAQDSADNPPDTTTRMNRQMQEFRDKFQVRLRDLEARCETGDAKSCTELTCTRLYTEGPSPRTYRDCATAEGYASTSVWAQTSKVSFDGSMNTEVSVVCLVNPTVMKLFGEMTTLYHPLTLSKSTYANAYHERERWSASVLEGPDFATWEEAADAICRGAKAK